MTNFDNQIHLFLTGQLKGDALHEFNDKLDSDDELLQLVAEVSVKEYGRDLLKQKLKGFDAELTQKKKTRRFYWVAAAMVIALGVPLILGLLNTKKSNSELFNHYFSVESVQVNTSDEGIKQAALSFNHQNFNKAIEQCNTLGYKSESAQFILGVSNLAKDSVNAQLAVQHLTKISDSSTYYHDALWYKSLSYLLMDSTSKAKISLTELTKTKHSHAQSAQLLLDNLKSN